ncbi:MAG: transcription antitermination factor NusB [Dehalococcoidia bacterium]|nr:transcription antitermination factor NusB [Dehalococcoidia bacterium]
MAGARQKARILALQALYEADTAHHSPAAAIERLLLETKLAAEAQSFARALVEGVTREREPIDAAIRTAAPLWPLEQVAVVDRNILRIAIQEILFSEGSAGQNPLPVEVVINEAVELGKLFGAENSARFINGVLGAINSRRSGELAAIVVEKSQSKS